MDGFRFRYKTNFHAISKYFNSFDRLSPGLSVFTAPIIFRFGSVLRLYDDKYIGAIVRDLKVYQRDFILSEVPAFSLSSFKIEASFVVVYSILYF